MKKLVISMLVSCVMLGAGCSRVNGGAPAKLVVDTIQDGTPFNLTPSTAVESHEVVNDTDSVQLAICEKVLDGCVEVKILDAKGVKCYKKLRSIRSVARYIELITECESEDIFYDTVGETDAWCDYVDMVLSPRGLAD